MELEYEQSENGFEFELMILEFIWGTGYFRYFKVSQASA